jgi:hypothetical protein
MAVLYDATGDERVLRRPRSSVRATQRSCPGSFHGSRSEGGEAVVGGVGIERLRSLVDIMSLIGDTAEGPWGGSDPQHWPRPRLLSRTVHRGVNGWPARRRDRAAGDVPAQW